MNLISRIFDNRFIGEFLKSQAGTRAVYKAYNNSLLARLLFLRANIFANIGENLVPVNIFEFTVSWIILINIIVCREKTYIQKMA